MYKVTSLYRAIKCLLLVCAIIVSNLATAANSLFFDSRYSTIKIYQNATLAIDQPITLFDGTLVKAVGAGVTGSIISFNDGIFEDAGNQIQLSGIFDPTGTIKLIGNNTCRVQPGTVLQNVTVTGVNNKLEGQPVFTNNISFLDSLSTLSVALQSQVNKNIVLTGGTLLLQNDLSFTDSAGVVGNGTIDSRGYRFITGGNPFTWSSNLTWNDLSHLYLSTNVDLTGSFTFRGQSSINGNGYILDVTNGGSITVASGATLDLEDLVINGLGSGGGQIFFVDDSSRVTVSNCTFDLVGSFTTSTGEVKAKGPMTVMVKSFTWNFNGTGDLIADGVTVWKDKGSASPCGNIIGNITLSNSGRVSYKKHKDDCDDDDDNGTSCCSVLQSQINVLSTSTTTIRSIVDTLSVQSQSCCATLQSQIDVVSTSTTKLQSIVDSLGSEIESCCDASAVCCSENEALALSCCDAASECCSLVDAKIESVQDALEECCSASEVCCSILDAKITSVQDVLVACCNASEDCCSRLDEKIESVADAAETCCSINEALSQSCCATLQSQIDVVSTSTTKLQSIVDSLGSEIDSCCSASEVCCSVLDAKIESVADSAAACCSANEALMLSCCEITEQCCSQSEALLSCCEEAAQCCSVNEALLTSCCDASLQCCSFVDAKIESCCEQSALCCSANEALTLSCCEGMSQSVTDCCSINEALTMSCCEEIQSRLEDLEETIEFIEDELIDHESRIEDLELVTGSAVTTVITTDGVFTSDMLPRADETRIIKFAPESQARNNALITLTIDPSLLDEGGLITLPSRSRLQFEGQGVIELLDGVSFNFQGSLAPRTRACVLEGTGMMGTGREDWPELMFADAVVIAIADGATINFGGEGSGFISIRQGAQLLVNTASHVIFGENSDAELDILFDENSMLTIDNPAALVTFQNATFDIVFDQNSECTIAQGICEFNSYQGMYAPGYVRKFYMIGGSTLNVQRLDNNAGRLEIAPNSDNGEIDFDNENGTVTGEGDIRYRSFDAQAVDSTLQIQARNVAGFYTASELFISLAALQEAALADIIQVQLGTLGNDSSGQVGQLIIGQAGNPAALCPELSTLTGFGQRSGRIVKLQEGDSSLFYDVSVPGGPFNVVSGLDGSGNVFRISNCDEATRV